MPHTSATARFAFIAPFFFLCGACGQSGPQLTCIEFHKTVHEMVEEIERNDLKVLDLGPAKGGSMAAACAQAKATVAQSEKLKKLVADHKDRCPEAMSWVQIQITTGSNPVIAEGYVEGCK
jgi:hypothetical protein